MTLLVDNPPTELAESLPRLESLVSEHCGIVHELHTLLAAPGDPRLVKVAATGSAAALVAQAERGVLDDGAGGYGTSAERARAAAIGEAAERYAGSFVPEESLVLATASELDAHAVDPERFMLFAPEQYAHAQFPFTSFERSTRVRWTRGFRLPDGAEAWLPAQLVYLSWHRLDAAESRIGYATSSGLACGPTLEEAILAGLLEVVERDAFMLAWYNRLSLPRLDWSHDAELRSFEERYLDPVGAGFEAVDLSVFLDVPVVAAIVVGDGMRQPATAVGAACSATVEAALKKAVAEAYAVRCWGRHLLATDPGRTFEREFADVVTFRDHIALHARPDYAEGTHFLTAATSSVPLSAVRPLEGATPLQQIRALTERLQTQRAGAYAVEVTTPDLTDAGLAVVKVVAPELCPLDVRHDARFLGGGRLRELPVELGLLPGELDWRDLNPIPHPFP